MFTGLPAIVYDKTVGGARSRINPDTGTLTSEENLHKAIEYMLDNYQQFDSRSWALRNTGSTNSRHKLDMCIRKTAVERGERYTTAIVEKINAPNLAYKDELIRAQFEPDYAYVRSCLQSRWSLQVRQ